MSEQKMISIEKMDEVVNDYYPAEETVDFNGLELVIKRIVPFRTEVEIINSVIDACFGGDDGAYEPEFMDFALKSCLVTAYTNVRLPQDVEHRHRIIYGTDLMDYIIQNISDAQFGDIVAAITNGVNVRCNMNRALFESRVHDTMNAISELSDKIAALFEGVTPEDMRGIMAALSDGGIDEEKLVKAVVAEQAKQKAEE